MARKKERDRIAMDWIYLSPHLDDVAFSCGGLVWEQVRSGHHVLIWPICAGLVPEGLLSAFAQELHLRWKMGPEAVILRREEDRQACERLGAEIRFFDIPDCIYRYRHLAESDQPLIQGEPDLYAAEPESDLIEALAKEFRKASVDNAKIVCPMALGNHVDHRLTRLAAEKSGLLLHYYADYPYVLRSFQELEQMETGGWMRLPAPISAAGLVAWKAAVVAHQSQISSFWTSLDEAWLAIQNYWAGGGGRVWMLK